MPPPKIYIYIHGVYVLIKKSDYLQNLLALVLPPPHPPVARGPSGHQNWTESPFVILRQFFLS